MQWTGNGNRVNLMKLTMEKVVKTLQVYLFLESLGLFEPLWGGGHNRGGDRGLHHF